VASIHSPSEVDLDLTGASNSNTHSASDSATTNTLSHKITGESHSSSGLLVSLPKDVERCLTPVEQPSSTAQPPPSGTSKANDTEVDFVASGTPTYFVPIEDADVMVGRSSKVYATSDSTSASREQLHSNMADPPEPNLIAMSDLPPRQDERPEQSDALTSTLHQVFIEV